MKEERDEKTQGIVVLDEGIEAEALIEPLSVCCGSVLVPIRGY